MGEVYMAVAESGGTIVHQTWTVPASSKRAAMMNFLKTHLTTAGMTITEKFGSSTLYTPFDLNMTNGETFTINGRTYTFVTSLSSADDILIGATAADSFNNCIAAINNAAGEGTLYGTGTTINADVTASVNTFSGHVGVLMLGKDATKAGLSVSEIGANLAWSSSTLAEPGLDITTATGPAFQIGQARAWYDNDGSGGKVQFELWDRTRVNFQQCGRIDGYGNDDPMLTTGVNWTLIANKYQFAFFANSQPSQNAASFFFSAPHIPTNFAPKKITGATNATPIKITCSAAHGYATGDTVLVKYVEGNTAANGTWTITVTSSTEFTLGTSVGNGTFSGTSGLVANQTAGKEEFLEVVITNGSNALGAFITFRESSAWGTTGASMIRDGTFFPLAGTKVRYGMAWMNLPTQDASDTPEWINGALIGGEPWLGISSAPGVSDPKLGVMLWDAFQSQTATAGEFQTTADGKTWKNVMDLSDSSTSGGGQRSKLALWLRVA